MEINIKISTWNLCLGLPNKKDLVTDCLRTNKISICCLQETEVPNNYPEDQLNCNKYLLELEMSSQKRRAGIYLSSDLNYVRRIDLEKADCHIVIVDVLANVKFRLINVYRSFHPPGGVSPSDFFSAQLSIIRNALCKNCLVMGDFNLDHGRDLRQDYCNMTLLKTLRDFTSEMKLLQVVDFNTWSRSINGIKKESLLDHIYLNNPESLCSVYFDTPIFGDHVLVIAELSLGAGTKQNNNFLKRNWRSYSSTKLNNYLVPLIHASFFDLNCSVQAIWNQLEYILIRSVDTIAPLEETKQYFNDNKCVQSIPPTVKNKINKRKRLIAIDRKNKNSSHLDTIRLLSCEIRVHFKTSKREGIQRVAMGTGNGGDIWKAVKLARNINPGT